MVEALILVVEEFCRREPECRGELLKLDNIDASLPAF